MNRKTAIPLSLKPSVLLTARALAACGGGSGGDGDMPASRAVPLRDSEPVVVGNHGANAVSDWNRIAFDTTQVPSSPAGTTASERVAGPDERGGHAGHREQHLARAGVRIL